MQERLLDYRFYGIGAAIAIISLFALPMLVGTLYHYYVHGSLAGLDFSRSIDDRSKAFIARMTLVIMCILFYFLSIMLFSFLLEYFLRMQKGIANQHHPLVAFLEIHKHQIVGGLKKTVLVITTISIIFFQLFYKDK